MRRNKRETVKKEQVAYVLVSPAAIEAVKVKRFHSHVEQTLNSPEGSCELRGCRCVGSAFSWHNQIKILDCAWKEKQMRMLQKQSSQADLYFEVWI